MSFDASQNSGVTTYFQGSLGYGSFGTSLSSPCWAGLIAIANQGRVAAGGTTLTVPANPTQTLQALYSLPGRRFLRHHHRLQRFPCRGRLRRRSPAAARRSPICLIPDLVNYGLPRLNPRTLPNGTYGTAYSQTIGAAETSGAGGPYTFAITAGALPTGLSLATGGVLSGDPTSVGTFSFTVTATDSVGAMGSQAYTLTVTPATITVSGITAANKIYNASTAATLNTTNVTLVGVISGDAVSLNTSDATGTFASDSVGTGITVTVAGLTIGGAQADDYTLTQPTTTASITPAPLTVSGVTAAGKPYDASTAATVNTSGATLVGVYSGDSVDLNSGAATGTFTADSVGTGITVTVAGLWISGAQAGDYTLTQPTTTASITPAPLTVSGVTAANKRYNASTAATLNTSAATLVGVFSGDTLNLNTGGATGTFASAGVGTGITVTVAGLSISGAQAGDYTLTQPTITASITPAPLTVSGITAADKPYDASTAATVNTSGATLVGVYTGDSVHLNSGAAAGTFASAGVGTGITVTVAGLSISGAQAGDYTLTQPTITASITAAPLTVSGITAANEVYNASTAATLNTSAATLVGVFSGDTVNLNIGAAAGTFASAGVWAGITVTVAGLSISGAQAGDYTLTQPTTTASITPAPLTVSGITAANKVYNVSTAATLNTSAATLVGVFSGDSVNLNIGAAAGTFASAGVGTGITVTVAGLSISGAQAGDYTLTQPTTTASITAAPLTVAGITAANKVYNASTAATLNTSAATLVGVFSGDSVNLNIGAAAGTFASAGVGTGITVTVAELSISGAQAGDYTLIQPTITASITAAPLTVSGITAANKVYNASTAATLNTSAATLVGVFSGDTVNLNTGAAAGTFAADSVGNAITVSVAGLTIGGAQAGDYTLTQPTTTASITPAPLTVTASNNQSMTYGGTAPALTYTYAGLVNGDSSASFTGSLSTTAAPSSNVGSYPITLGSLAATGNYTIGTLNQGVLTVNAARLTVTASNKGVTYGGAVPALTYRYTGLVNGDTSASFTGSLSTTATKSSDAGSYPIIQGSLAATGNYMIGTFDQGTLKINPASTVVSLTPTYLTPKHGKKMYELEVTVTRTVPGGPIPAGTVIFQRNGKTFGSAVLQKGAAMISLGTTRPTNSKFQAVFQGDRDFTSSTSPHELPRLLRCVRRLRGGCFRLECWTAPTIPPTPVSRTDAGGFGFSALCMTRGASRDGNRLDQYKLRRGQRTELEAQHRRLSLQRLEDVSRHLGLVLFHRLRYVLLAVLEHPVDQTRQLVRGGLDCSESAEPTADAAVEQAQRRHCFAQRPGTHPQRDGHSVRALAMAAASLRLVALILRRTQPQPTGEVFLGGKAADVHADFSQNHQGRSHVDPLDHCQVHAQGLEQRAGRLEPHVVALAPALPRLDNPSLFSRPVGEIGQFCLDLLVALGDLSMMELVQLIGLPKLEKMLGPPRSFQRKGYLFLTVLTSLMAQFSQFDGVTFALQDGFDDRHTGQPRDVADDFGQFDIHLLHGLLHVLGVAGGVANLHLPLPPVGTQRQHGIRRPKRRTQETVGVQPLDPLRVEHVRLGARTATRKLPRFHQLDVEALRFKELEQRNPVDAGGFQSDRFHAALL